MKRQTLFSVDIVLVLIALVACIQVSFSPPVNIPSPITSTTVSAILTPKPDKTSIQKNASTPTPFINKKASEDCFLTIDFIPGQTGMDDVFSTWGSPSSKSSLDESLEFWQYDVIGTPDITFKKQKIHTINFSLKNCPLEKIIAKLGTPEKIEIVTLRSCTSRHSWITQNFHYPSLGFLFSRSCDETQKCFVFNPSDDVNGKEFYVPGKTIKDWHGVTVSGLIYNWHGFGIDVENVEDKIKDKTNTVTKTPIP